MHLSTNEFSLVDKVLRHHREGARDDDMDTNGDTFVAIISANENLHSLRPATKHIKIFKHTYILKGMF